VNWPRRLLSWLYPVPVEKVQGMMGPLEVRWEDGHKVLNSSNGNQSFGSLHEVWARTFEAIDLPARRPATVLMLGLGGGSVPHILASELDMKVELTVLEMDPVMIDLARRHFGLDELKVRVIQGDALMRIHLLKERFDLVLVDLFIDLDMARGVETNGFAHALRDRCSSDGLVCFNTVAYDEASSLRCDRIADQLKKVFLNVKELRFEGVNRVFVAN
jgi:spermidine synthase